MSDRKASPFPILLNNDVCSLIQAAEDVYQIRFKNRAANAYLVRGKSRTIMIDVGLTSNFPALLECLNHLDCPPEKIDMVILSHEHLDHIGAAWHFNEQRTIIAAHRLADARGGQPHAKPQILGVAKLRFDRPALGVMVDQRCRGRVPLAARQTPRFLHVLGVHAEHSADLLALCGHPCVDKLAGAATPAHPFITSMTMF